MTAVGIYTYFTSENTALNELEDSLFKSTERLSHSLAYTIWNINLKEAEKMISLEMTDEDVFAVIVKNDNDKFYTGKIRDKNWNIIDYDNTDEMMKKRINSVYLAQKKSIVKNNMGYEETIGYVEVYLSDRFVNKYLKQLVISLIIQTALISIISFLAIFLILNRTILNHIINLDNVVTEFAKKDFKVRAKAESKDEIGHLSKSFNLMAEIIQEYSENLEEMVDRRTKELDIANKGLKRQNGIMLKELEMAKRVQENIIPTSDQLAEVNSCLNFGSSYTAMEGIGGDLYDVMKIGRTTLGFLIADVSGHGVPAALITSMVKVAFTANSRWNIDSKETCYRVNRELYKLIGDLEHYLTAYYCKLEMLTGEFQFTNCGHHPAILCRAKTKSIEKLLTKGFVVGAIRSVIYESKTIRLEEGDKILLFTDGIIEARNKSGEFYEYERLFEYINRSWDLYARDFVDGLIKDVEDFCGERPADDDRAVLYIEFVNKLSDKNNTGDISDSLIIESKRVHVENKNKIKEEMSIDVKKRYTDAVKYIKEKNYNKALEILEAIREIMPNNAKILNNLGVVLYKKGDYKKAYDILKQLHDEGNSTENTEINLALVKKKLEK